MMVHRSSGDVLAPAEMENLKLLPNFLVIGAPRSGTTWIDENLRRHPDVFLPEKKELHFFDLNFDRGSDYYESFFSGWSGQRAVGEATPDYLHGAYSKHDIPASIHRLLPGVKLIASLRNPVDRAYSRYLNSKAKYEENVGLSFEDKLRQKPEFIAEGFYYDQLKRYYELFPRENILVLLYDDMLSDPSAFMRRIYTFLGVDANVQTGFETARINTAAGKGNLAKSKVLWYASRLLSRLNLHKAATNLAIQNSKPIEALSAESRRWLVATYRDQNEKLAKLIGRDLSVWNA